MPVNPKPASIKQLRTPLLACAVIFLLWPASYYFSDALRVAIGAHRMELNTGPGWVTFTRGTNDPARHFPAVQNAFIRIDAAHRSAMAYTRIYSSPGDYRFYFPLWMLSLASGLAGLAVIVSHYLQAKRYKPGCCENCGYDLRASPDRCPECGNAIDTIKSHPV